MSDKPIIFYAVYRNDWGAMRDVAVTRETDNSFFYLAGAANRETRMNKPSRVVRCSTFEASRDARKRMGEMLSVHGNQKAELSRRHHDEWCALVALLNAEQVTP